jgi:hypothetical protein
VFANLSDTLARMENTYRLPRSNTKLRVAAVLPTPSVEVVAYRLLVVERKPLVAHSNQRKGRHNIQPNYPANLGPSHVPILDHKLLVANRHHSHRHNHRPLKHSNPHYLLEHSKVQMQVKLQW